MPTSSFLTTRSGSRSRLVALGRAVAYLALALGGALFVSALAKTLAGASLLELAQGGAAAGTARAVLLLFGVVILPTAIVLWVFKEPFQLSAWRLGSAARLTAWGLVTGLSLIAAIAGVMWLFGAVTFGVAVPTMSAAVSSLMISAILWFTQAAGEEGLHRGYAFVQICRAISFWPTAILSSAWFMYGHVGNEGETVLGIIAAGLLGLALSYSLLKTGSLWFALGFHASWNFSQSFVFGFHNSGGKPPASLLSATVDGSPLLTGGTTGPEASLLVLPALLVLLTIVHRVAVPSSERPGGPMPSAPTPG